MSKLITLALISTAMLAANAQVGQTDSQIAQQKAEAARREQIKRDQRQKDVADILGEGKTKDQKDLEAYYKSIGEDVPSGKLPTGNTDDDDFTQGHENDPYWNYETGQDDDPGLVDRPWFYMFKQVRYIVYFSLVAVPWIILGALCVATNIVINIGFNDGWAGGNVYLISQTAYLVLQYLLSVILFLEVDPWLRYMKFIRIGSLFMSWFYLLIYIILSILLVVILDDLDNSEVTYMSMYTVMVLSYNLIFHTPVLLVNIMIVIKEFSMEFIQFCNDIAGTGMDDYSLAARNITDLFVDLTNWINPWWWSEAVEDTSMWDSMYE